jgi:uncharacterized membrane protein YfcA
MHAALLAAVAVWCFVVAFAGGVAGLVLGNIRLPAILVVTSSPAAGAGANIGISGLAAAAAAVSHVRAGRVDWRLVRWLAVPSVVGAVLGGLAGGWLPGRGLLAVIGATLLYFGLDLLRPRPRTAAVAGEPRFVPVALAGLGIGLVGGLVGLILGALRLPTLLRMGARLDTLPGTNLVVGVLVGAAGLVGHTPGGVDWTVLAVGASASVPGALLGARLTGMLGERQLLRVVGAILLVAAAAILLQAAVG